MLRSRWPGTVDPVTLDSHCQLILEVPARPNGLLASDTTNVGFCTRLVYFCTADELYFVPYSVS